MQARVGIVMGSDSDLDIMRAGGEVLHTLGIPYEFVIASAHRSPDKTAAYARDAHARGIAVIIAGAGYAAHLGGALAAQTILPVIGVPLDTSSLQGLDALLAISQMPAGIPVAAVTIGTAGAKNAAYLAAQILALSDAALAERLRRYRQSLVEEIEKKDRTLRA
ncbi:MAG: 5-(carboxyamino)imidazole ribonucleotide mutase [Deltaproteobacteria bacterium]|nr:5-(carboxyamino)imidazole ribonucleotide mutase [Deltaproteobacteria bacterium]